MKKPKVFGFYGKSGSGKTRLLVDIIKRLTNDGLNVASIKISDKKGQKLLHDMKERVKELNCLYGLSKLVETPNISLVFRDSIKRIKI
jgi:Ni2+-binding GTPase involved in maturation of urease and hydrogenase